MIGWVRRQLRRILLGTTSFIVACVPTSIHNPSAMPTQRDPIVEMRALRVSSVLNEIGPRLTKLEQHESKRVAEVIVEECDQTGFDPLFILAVIESESGYDIEAVSPSGARGLMQLLPSTFRDVSAAKRMFDPVENVRAGIRYLHRLTGAGFLRPEALLLAYNQGPGTAIEVRQNGMEMPEEGRVYVPRVMDSYKKLLQKNGKPPKDARKLFRVTQ